MYNTLLLALVAGFSWSALAMDPLVAMDLRDQDYGYYDAYVRLEDKTIAPDQLRHYSDFNDLGVSGRVVPIADGPTANRLNLVLNVNGSLYYVDSVLKDIYSFKLRRRWKNNPEPGVFLRVDGSRYNPRLRMDERVNLWIKLATPEGRALPVLRILEGNFDL